MLQSQAAATDKTASVILDIESLVQSQDKCPGSPKLSVSSVWSSILDFKHVKTCFDYVSPYIFYFSPLESSLPKGF